jgi:hypothetical protein
MKTRGFLFEPSSVTSLSDQPVIFNKGLRHRLGGRVPEANAEIRPNSYLFCSYILGDIDRLLVAFFMILCLHQHRAARPASLPALPYR